jgi:hypothetical protein
VVLCRACIGGGGRALEACKSSGADTVYIEPAGPWKGPFVEILQQPSKRFRGHAMTDEEKLAAIKKIFDGYGFGSMRAGSAPNPLRALAADVCCRSGAGLAVRR